MVDTSKHDPNKDGSTSSPSKKLTAESSKKKLERPLNKTPTSFLLKMSTAEPSKKKQVRVTLL